MAKFIKVSGETNEVFPSSGKDFKLNELQKFVDGCIEIIHLTNDQIMVINDEGKFVCEKNNKATEIAHEHQAIFKDDYIAGDVLICNSREVL